MNRIQHNYPSLIRCLRIFHILVYAYLLSRCYCYNHYKTQTHYFCYRYLYYHTTLLLNTLLQILSYPGVVELTTQLLILKNILWLPFCRINKFGMKTLPSKTIVIPYTCGLSTLIEFPRHLMSIFQIWTTNKCSSSPKWLEKLYMCPWVHV